MTNTIESNKRIAKNSMLLYFRMLLMILINLYTQRVILATLGVEDFGINNVVAGVITMLGFLTGSLSAVSSRYITYDLGKGDMEVMKKTFGNILSIHLLIAVVVFIVGETVGLWFMTTQLQIPAERETAAFWVYQFSIFSSMLAVISSPYNAAIIAHEKMSAFAYISIADAFLKLLIVYLLVVIPYDKLIIYAILLFTIQCFDRLIYGLYCRKHFLETHTNLAFNKKLFKDLFTFAGWTMNGSLAVIGYTQGLNVLLNIFFGPVVNAARGIAVQIQTVARNFCINFQMALNPQLTKSYAIQNYPHMHQLLKASSKYSFYLMLLISLPIMLEVPMILEWWLGVVPKHTVNFVRLTLCSNMLYALANPIIVSVHATGTLKRFQIIEGSMLLTILPIAYFLLKFCSVPPETVFMVHLIIEIFTQVARVRIVLPMIQMRIKEYVEDVFYPIVKVLFFASIIPIILYLYLDQGLPSFFIVVAVSVINILIIIYTIGCTNSERMLIQNKVINLHRKIVGKNDN